MKAVVFHGVGDIRLEDVPEPKLLEPTDAIVRLTASAICGTDLHLVRGTVEGMKPGTVLGHEGVGVVEEVGKGVRNLKPGDRVVIPSTIACGDCVYCRAGYYAQCDRANPNGPMAGTAFFGGPKMSGPFQGLQAEWARVPFAQVGPVKLPEEVSDDQAILLSDIFPTGYFGASLANIEPGRTLVVFGCGPVGQFAIASARLMDAGRILAVDCIPSRLEMARRQGAEVIDFSREEPVAVVHELTSGIGADRAIDAVGVDATRAHHGPAAPNADQRRDFESERCQIAPHAKPKDGNWHPGDAPSQVLTWAVKSLAKAGTLGIIGVYADNSERFPVGTAMEKNLTIRMGNCHHRKYLPHLLRLVAGGAVRPESVLTQRQPMTSAIEAYRSFDRREPGWIKVELQPAAPARKAA
ncbi:MAG TPA: zinc-dependent alcohol dehydrogenase [Terriglobales bacterium]|nr:zinc-dependent alcohol dehydrogenase [Terriglobales bacterium]